MGTSPTAVLQPPDSLLAHTTETKLPFSAKLTSVVPLPGDASNRRYYRLHLNGGSRSLIVMQLASPEGFKQSEEAVSGATSDITELPFINILKHLAAVGVPVPSLHYYDQDAGLLYLEDMGERTLAEVCELDPGRIDSLYRQAIDILVRMHTVGTRPPVARCLAFARAFDVPLLMWEFEHFLEYGIGARQGRPMDSADEHIVRTEFRKIAELLAGLPQVFTHRDYHSRNLMVEDDRLGVIDFQDALMGPPVYDLASLLRDAYRSLEEPLIDALLAQYRAGVAKAGHAVAEPTAFRRLFDLMSVQRNLKAAGRFVYIDRVKGNAKFLADIPRVLSYVRRNLAAYPELATLSHHLVPYVPELQEP